jgi:hypothetical protein
LSICNRIRIGKSLSLGVFIKSGLFQEAFDFEAFIHPFVASTWLCLFCSAALLAVCIIIIWKTTNYKKRILSSGFKVYIKILQTNLGNANFVLYPNLLESSKVLILTALLMGNFVWMIYQGSLLSELLAPKVTKPFHDLKTLVDSNYRFDAF